MKSKTIISCLVAGLFMSGCGKIEMYKPAGTGGFFGKDVGYSESKIAKKKWLVKYTSAAGANDEDTWKYLLRRTKEVGLSNCKGKYTVSNESVKTELVTGLDRTYYKLGTAVVTCK